MAQNESALLTCGEVAKILRLLDNGSENPEEQIVHMVEVHGLPCLELPLKDAPNHHRYLFNRDDVIDWLVHRQSLQAVDEETELSDLDVYKRLSAKSQNVLNDNEVVTVGQIRQAAPRRMSEWHSCGGKTLAELTRFRAFVLKMVADRGVDNSKEHGSHPDANSETTENGELMRSPNS